MSGRTSRRVLQVFLTVLGCVAVVAGATTVLLGADSVVGAEPTSATIDSEMRFYAVWYMGAGLVLLRSVPRVESATLTVAAIAALLFVAGAARALSWLTVGRPHTVAVALMAVELALPLVIVPWQAAVARRKTSTV